MAFLHQVALVSEWVGIPLLIYGGLTFIFWWAANAWDRITVLRISGALLATITFWLGFALASGGCGLALLGAVLVLPCGAIAITVAVRLPRTLRTHRLSTLVLALAPFLGVVVGVLAFFLAGSAQSCP